MVRSPSAGSQQFRNMLRVAREMGCQLQRGMENPDHLNGLCPFHESRNLQEAKTLRVDTANASFWCVTCNVSGNPLSFIARVWGVTSQDAYALIEEGHEVTAPRPRRDPEVYRRRPDRPPSIQNTALLTMAARFYGERVESSYPALCCLAKLGIEPRVARELGFGYCPGEGLQQRLEEWGADPGEIETSPLFQEDTGLEALGGWITLADTDPTGAAMWMTGIMPDPPGNWNLHRGRPRMRGLPGQRRNLLNLTRVNRGARLVAVTDDPRLYLALRADGQPAVLSVAVRRRENAEALPGRLADALARREPGSLVIAMHDSQLAQALAEESRRRREETTVSIRSQARMMRELDPRERNIREFLRETAEGRNGRRRQDGEETAGTNGSGNLAEIPAVESIPAAVEEETPAAEPGPDTGVEEKTAEETVAGKNAPAMDPAGVTAAVTAQETGSGKNAPAAGEEITPLAGTPGGPGQS